MDNNTKTDYEILTDFLRLTTHRKKIDDISTRKYIKYYCDIHIDHVIQNFLPAKMFNDITGGRHDWSITKNMILGEVIKNLQTANKHLTIGDFYKDIFLMTAPFGLNESELPKICPSEASKQILSDLCNPQLVAKCFDDNQSDILYQDKFPLSTLLWSTGLGGFAVFAASQTEFINDMTTYQELLRISAQNALLATFIICAIVYLPMYIAWKRNTKNKHTVYTLSFISGIFGIIPLFTVIALILALTGTLRSTSPRNRGVRRLCVFTSIVLGTIVALYTDWDQDLSILYLTLAFIAPFILTKIIEYIVDGFKQK